MSRAAIDALRAEQQRALALFASLTPEEWQAASGCTGWRVQDVAQHMASTFHQIADPSSIEGGSSEHAEENAEVPVQARREWGVDELLSEYREWSDKGVAALAGLQEPPLADNVIPLADLGSHPMHILANAIVFDHYCHLRHDIGAAVPRAAELPRDAASLDATLEWMLAGLPQMCAAALGRCSQGVNLVFEGAPTQGYALRPGESVADHWSVTTGIDPSLPNAVTTAHDFVSWGTKRADWRDLGVEMADVDGATTLDAINVI